MAWKDTWSEITNHPEWKDLPSDVQLKVTRNFANKIVGPEVGKNSDAYKGFIQENIISRTVRHGDIRLGSIGAGFKEGFNRNLGGLAVQAATGRKALREEGSAIADTPMSILAETAGGIMGELADPIGLTVDVVTGGIGGKLVKQAAKPLAKKAIAVGAGATSGAVQDAGFGALQGQVNGEINAGDVAKTTALGALLGGAIPAAAANRRPAPRASIPQQQRPMALPPIPEEAAMIDSGVPSDVRVNVMQRWNEARRAELAKTVEQLKGLDIRDLNEYARMGDQGHLAPDVYAAVRSEIAARSSDSRALPPTQMEAQMMAAGLTPEQRAQVLANAQNPAQAPAPLQLPERSQINVPPGGFQAPRQVQDAMTAQIPRVEFNSQAPQPVQPSQPLLLPERVPINVPPGGFQDPDAAFVRPFGTPPVNHRRLADELSFAYDVAANSGNQQAMTKLVQALEALEAHQGGQRHLPVEQMVREAIDAVNPTAPVGDAGQLISQAARKPVNPNSTKGLVRSDAIYTHQANKAIEAEAAAIEQMRPQIRQEIGERLAQAMANRDLDAAIQLGRLGRAVDDAAWAHQLKDIRHVLDGDTDQSLLARIFRDEEGALDLEALRATARRVGNRLGRAVDEVGGRAILGQIEGINPSDAAAFVGPGVQNLRGEAKRAVREFTQGERPRATAMPHAVKAVDPEDFLNFSKFAISEGEAGNLARLVQQSVAETQGNPKRVVTFDEIKAEAAKIDPRLIAELRPPKDGHTIHPAVRQAARDRLNAINSEAYRRSVELEKVRHTMTEAEVRAEESVIHRLERDGKGIIDVLYPARSQDGRNLAFHRMAASNSFDADYWVSRAKRAAGGVLADDKLRAVRDLIARGAEAQAKGDKAEADNVRFLLAKELMKLEKSGPMEAVLALRKAGLLSSVKTHTRNLLGNAGFAAVEEIRRLPSALVDMAMATATGNRTVAGPSGKAIWRSTYEAATRGIKEAKEVLRHGATFDDLVNLKLGREVNSGNKILDAYANFLFRSLSAEDRVFKAYAWRRSIEAQAKLKAINEGLKGEAARKAIKEYSEKPTSEMIAQAIADADVATFTNENLLAKGIQRLESASPAIKAGVDLLVPFKNTPLNIIARILDYTGAGAAVEGGKIIASRLKAEKVLGALKPEEQRAIADALGRGLTGWGVILLGYKLAEAGALTGTFQPEKDQRNLDEVAGRSPGAVKVGGAWHQIGALAPLGNLLIIGATLHRDGGGPIGALAIGAKTALDQPFFQGLEQVTTLAQDPAEEAPKLTGDIAGSFVPTFVNDMATALDDTKREAKSPGERIQNRIPGLRNQLPAKVDALGREVPNDRLNAFNAFLSREAQEDADPVVGELVRLNIGLSPIGKQLSMGSGESVALTSAQIQALTQLTGENVMERLSKVIERPAFQRYDDDRKKAILEKVITNARAQARRQMIREMVKAR